MIKKSEKNQNNFGLALISSRARRCRGNLPAISEFTGGSQQWDLHVHTQASLIKESNSTADASSAASQKAFRGSNCASWRRWRHETDASTRTSCFQMKPWIKCLAMSKLLFVLRSSTTPFGQRTGLAGP
jgi:hypothetical protein